jgi:xylulokinase
MGGSEKNIAFAALDIGTSQIKLGVYCPSLSEKIIPINSLPSDLIYGTAGEVRVEYGITRERCFTLFTELGSFLKKNQIPVLYLGICGHISSLIEWDRVRGLPPEQPFPIWLDTTSYPSLDEYNAVMGEGKSQRIIGTFLPPGTNWLLTKLMHRRKAGFSPDSIFLQAGDCLFYELCEEYNTHFSSPLSMVDLHKREYARELLDHLGLDPSSLPTIDPGPRPVLSSQKQLFGFPDESFVFPAMADLHTSLYGLRLRDKEGFMLANTSEQAGVFFSEAPKPADHFLHISFDHGFVNYGSTNTGGNVVNWFLSNVLGKEMKSETLDELTLKAAAIGPEDTPLILPYLQGERAPLWNSRLTASILELRSSHTEAHLFRALLESIAFARRQCFEELGIGPLTLIKLAGGSSKNALWNAIRASVLNKPVAVADEKELAMAGLIYYLMEGTGSSLARPAIEFSIMEPDPLWVGVYGKRYAKFIKYQELLH